ncbi:diguanylate cyclase (GGDEF) domain-containing protein [Sphingomonas guangdongensis]|uniref:diguanylate cyclase n=1 Tax=Sphingomonas guangdongensis TaxID=1141890 RepID=A0A285R256_9SPHN|nr:diguanylate cyclase [Sphingomonas guangdongensis]SOB88171.1 diguanylate cyclase (GGDEF) domain-containing protein [Sphingomonas guangdongensis]
MAGWTIWKAVLATVLAVVALCAAMPVRAQLADVPLATCIAPVRPGDTPAAMLTTPARFTCDTRQHLLGAGDFWALSEPITARLPHYPRIRLASLWQRSLTLYAVYADGKVARLHADSRQLSSYIQLGAHPEFKLSPRPARLQRLLFRIDGSANARGVLLRLAVVDAQSSSRSNTQMAAIYAGFAGLALALLVYNLALFGAMRHRFQLAYCAMVVMLAGYALSSSGALAWLYPAIDNNDRLRINYITLGLTAAAAVQFARHYFEDSVFAGWLSPATGVASALLALSGLVFAILSPFGMVVADCVYQWSFVAGLSIVVPILHRAWRVQSRFLWLFSLAWAAPIFFALARTLAVMHLIPMSFWMDNSTVLSMALEALLSSLAIAYRVQMLSRERDEARARALSLKMLADADPLTGLLNRRAFLHAAIGRTGAQTLHIIDIDHFKAVNDTLGHDGGDEVLRRFARTLRQMAAGDTLVTRLGGEEFAVLASADHPIDAERMLTALRRAPMPFDLSVTASIGTCVGPLTTEAEWKLLYRSADRALFDAKAAGRDRVRRGQMRALAA